MRNLFVAALAALSLGAFAQAPASEWTFELDTDCNGTTQVYEAVVVNAGTVNINAQLIAPDGSTKNFHANIQQETATLEGQDVCGCVTTPDTGLASGNVTHCIGAEETTTLACPGSALNVNGTLIPIVQVVEQENDNVLVLVTDTGVEYLFFRENACFYTFDFACLNEDTNTFVFINGQGTITISEELWSCLDLPCVCPEDLSAEYAACQAANSQLSATVSAQGAQIVSLENVVTTVQGQLADCSDANQSLLELVDSLQTANAALEDYNAWADQTISNLQYNYGVVSNDLYVWQSAYQTLSAQFDSLEAVNDNLVAENQELATDLYECQSDLATTESHLDNCADNLDAWQLAYVEDINAVNAELGACEDVNDSLYAALADLTVDLANMTAEADTCFMEYVALDDQFIDAVEEYEGIIDNLNTQLDELADQSVTIITNLQEQLDDCTATSENLAAQLNDCEIAGVAIASELQSQLLACQGQLEDAQEAASACPAAIETAVANALAIAEEECNLAQMEVAAAQWQLGYDAAIVDLDAAYEAGKVDGRQLFIDEELPQLLNAEWWLGYNDGYNAGLQACEDGVSGLVDIDGTTIAVTGYYNEMGQVIDPARTTGVIIRRHEDGTFSKYIKTLR